MDFKFSSGSPSEEDLCIFGLIFLVEATDRMGLFSNVGIAEQYKEGTKESQKELKKFRRGWRRALLGRRVVRVVVAIGDLTFFPGTTGANQGGTSKTSEQCHCQ